MRPHRLLPPLLLALGAAALPAADFYRDPPPSPVYQRILGRGEMGRDLRALYEEARLVRDAPEKLRDGDWVRRVKTLVMALGVTDRRVDGDFVAGRLLDALGAQRPRNLYFIAEFHTLRGFLLYATGFRIQAEPHMRKGVHFGNRARGARLRRSALECDLLAGLLRSRDYGFLAQLMDDQARAFRNMLQRRMGGVRIERPREGHERVPAMVFRTLKDELVKVEQARLALDESDGALARANAAAARAELPRGEYNAIQAEVLLAVRELAEQRKYLKSFLFQLRRSSDLEVARIRAENIADFRQLHRELLERQQQMLGQLLVARYKNAY